MKVTTKHGTEGPRHDPYSYTEYTATKDGYLSCLHVGLGVALELGGCKLDVYGSHPNPDKAEAAAIALFEFVAGQTLDQIEEAENPDRCPDCGGCDIEWQRGHPGEHLLVCENGCGIVSSRFNESEII